MKRYRSGLERLDKRAQWMGEYEAKLVEARPEMQGHVDWDTATYLFFSGKTPTEAAEQYLENHKRF